MIMMSQKLVIGLMVVLVMLLGSGTNAETNSRKFSAKSVAGRPSVSGKQSSAIKQQRRPTNKLAKSSMFSAFFRSLVFEAEDYDSTDAAGRQTTQDHHAAFHVPTSSVGSVAGPVCGPNGCCY
jgi:hypothetical protein